MRGEEILEGFTIGNTKDEARWLQGMPYLDVNKFKPYVVETHGTVQESFFERPRTQAIYQAPLALIRQSTCEAAFLAVGQVAYRHKVTGIPGQQGQEYLLKWLVAYVNSSLARYYHFLTSNSWAVERGTIIHEEYKRMPFLLPDEDDPRLRKLLGYFDQLVALSRQTDELLSRDHTSDIQRIKDNIDDLVFDIYNIFPMARQLVRDMIEYEIKFFQWAKRKTRTLNDSYARSVRRPEPQLLKEYAMAFIEIVTTFLRFQDQTLNATVYQDGIPLNVLEFELVHLADAREVQFEGESKELRDLLYKLDRHLLENYASGLYTRRHVRIFDGSHFYLVRPSERRLWTRSQAYADADGFIVEMLAKSKAEAGVSY